MLMAVLNWLLPLIKADLMEIFNTESFIRGWQTGRQAGRQSHPSPIPENNTHIHTLAHVHPDGHGQPPSLLVDLIGDDTAVPAHITTSENSLLRD